MNLKSEQKKVQTAMDAALSGLQEDPWLAQRVLANTKGEEPVKKRGIGALVLVVILVLAMAGTACAVFSSQIAEYFGRFWGADQGERLKEGKIAQVEDSVTVSGLVFTLEEVAYKDQAFYGLVTIRTADEKDVLIGADTADIVRSDPENLSRKRRFEKAKEKAKASGGRVLAGRAIPYQIGVDDGTMLESGWSSHEQENADGTVSFSFMIKNGFAVNEGTSYQLNMAYIGYSVDDNGEEQNADSKFKMLSFVPVMAQESVKPAEPEQEVSTEELAGYAVAAPAAWQETGTLPVRLAVNIYFTESMDPEQSGTAGDQELSLKDTGNLWVGKNAVWYDENPEDEDEKTSVQAIMDLMWLVVSDEYDTEFVPDLKELSGITLEEAQQQAEALLSRLGLDCNRYTCTYGLDMSLNRIRRLAARYKNRNRHNGATMVIPGLDEYDFEAIPETEEGYYLVYRPEEIDTENCTDNFGAVFYVNSRGIAYVRIKNEFDLGEVVYTPEKLISADDAVRRTVQEIKHFQDGASTAIVAVKKAELNYVPVRADDKAEGMVFVPAWTVVYTGAEEDPESYAVFNAIDGSLIDAGKTKSLLYMR